MPESSYKSSFQWNRKHTFVSFCWRDNLIFRTKPRVTYVFSQRLLVRQKGGFHRAKKRSSLFFQIWIELANMICGKFPDSMDHHKKKTMRTISSDISTCQKRLDLIKNYPSNSVQKFKAYHGFFQSALWICITKSRRVQSSMRFLLEIFKKSEILRSTSVLPPQVRRWSETKMVRRRNIFFKSSKWYSTPPHENISAAAPQHTFKAADTRQFNKPLLSTIDSQVSNVLKRFWPVLASLFRA